MKGLILTTTMVLVLMCSKLSAQQNSYDLGVIAGTGYSSLRGNENEFSSSRPMQSFYGGLLLRYNFPKTFFLQTGLALENKGSVYVGKMTDAKGNQLGTFSEKFNFEYFTVPLLMGAAVGKKIRLYASGGPYVSYLARNTHTTKTSTGIEAVYVDTYFYNQWDLGLSAGLGVSVPLKKRLAVFCELRDNLGLYNISALAIYNDGTIKTNAANLLIGIYYKTGQRSN
jgi:hypothetical protein